MKFNYCSDIISFSFKNLLSRIFSGKEFDKPKVFYSTKYNYSFDQFRDYWMMIGEKSNSLQRIVGVEKLKVVKMSLEEVIQRVTPGVVGNSSAAIFYNIDSYMFSKMADKIPELLFNPATDDILILSGKSRENVRKLVESIGDNVADVIGVQDGAIFCSNKDL